MSTVGVRWQRTAVIAVAGLVVAGCAQSGLPRATATPVDGDAAGVAAAAGGGAAGGDAAGAEQAAADGEAGPASVFARIEFDVIDDERLAALRSIEGVASVSAPRSDDIALVGSTRSDGTPVDSLPPDFKISLGGIVDDGEVGLGLASGQIAMTSTGLAFRDLDVGATVVLAGGVRTTVTSIADDPLLQGYELIVSAADAETLGVRGRQRALLRLEPGADAGVVADRAAAVLGENGIVQTRPADDDRLVLSLPETKRRFGEFAFRDLPGRDVEQGASFVGEHITRRDVPFFGVITCHEDIFDPLVAALQQIRDDGLGDEIDPTQYGGCWTPRRINRNANLSRHAWGIAVDINVDFDAPGGGPIPSDGVIAAFEQHGFRWGGDYPVPDNHHFEFQGQPAG